MSSRIDSFQTLSEAEIAQIMKQIFSAVHYCHCLHVMHRDLKPENILFTDDKPSLMLKVIDFGRSKFLKPREKVNELAGTVFFYLILLKLYYLAPEIVKNQAYNESCDMWSCGVIMYLLITGSLPFKESSNEKTLEAISTAEVKYGETVWSKVDPEAKNLVAALLNRNTSTRIKALDALHHPWIEKFTSMNEEEKKQTEDMVNSLRNLKTFKAQCAFHKAVLMYIASQFSDPKEEEKYIKLFNQIDKDKDGHVTKSDLYEAYLKIYNDKYKAALDATAAIRKNDFNGTGIINYTGTIFS